MTAVLYGRGRGSNKATEPQEGHGLPKDVLQCLVPWCQGTAKVGMLAYGVGQAAARSY